jgi:branched-chain amino acid transport system ATP-binding protein
MLEVAGLEVVYHSVALVLRGVSLKVPEGAVVALLGPNGAGKTTLLRAVAGLLPLHEGRVTKGHVSLFGERLGGEGADARVRRGLAQVMEGRRILGELTVEENLLAGGWSVPRGELSARLDAFYARFPVLGERRHRQAGYLSGGEQQLLAIARALVSRPRLLVLDEPSLGLAPRMVQEVAGLVRAIHAEGVSILLVEQNAAMALDLATYGYVLDNGRVVLDGTAAQLKADRDVRESYLGFGGEGAERRSFRDVKHYRRRKRWLS